MRKNWIGVGLLLSAIAAFSVLSGAMAGTRFVIALPNGYEMIRGKASEPMIIKRSGGVVVPGPIASFVVVHEVVTGLVQPDSTPSKADTAKKSASRSSNAKQGYFVLDTRTGEASVGLAESEWNERLKTLEIPASPQLAPPVLPK